jgi:hypothetical protein
MNRFLRHEGKRPMWHSEHRLPADRSGLRYLSDLTDAKRAIVEPMVPPATHGGRKRTIADARGFETALRSGCQWQALPQRPAAEEQSFGVILAYLRKRPQVSDDCNN